MSAGTLDLFIEQGATFRKTLTWKDSTGALVDLTGYTARMQAREPLEGALFLIELTTVNGRIALGGVLGTIVLVITDTDTDALAETKKAVYDLELVAPSGDVTRLVEGKFRVSPQVTR